MSSLRQTGRRQQLVTAMLLVCATSPAMATNGYFAHGAGIKSSAMGGATVALPLDSQTIASNPAGLSAVNDRVDLALTWFLPDRGGDISGNSLGLNGVYDGNDKENFFIPEFGIVKRINPSITAGFAAYGNGGLNTGYQKNPFASLGSSGVAGVDLAQLFLSPSLSYQVLPGTSMGIALNLIHQRFAATGLQAFDNAIFSSNPGFVTNRGFAHSNGVNGRIGLLSAVGPYITVGASYQNKARMSRFDKYKGLFAEAGQFDIPETYAVGFSVKPTQRLQASYELQRINYSHVRSVGSTFSAIEVLTTSNKLGSAQGPGFAWRDMQIHKVGVQYQAFRRLTLRTGYSVGQQPVPEEQTLLNLLAPGVIQKHVTFGGTYQLSKSNELNLGYTHALKNTVNGKNSIPTVPLTGGESNIYLEEKILSIGLSHSL